MNTLPAAAVTGFGPLNEGIQSAIDEAALAAARDVVPALSAEMTRRIRSDVLPGIMRDPRFTALAAPAGQAAGEEFFSRARPAIYVATGALLILAGAGLFYAVTHRGCK